MKKGLSIFLVLCLLVTWSPVYADSENEYKEEAVYGILGYDGMINQLYVVNGLKGLSQDYGQYTAVENMTTLSGMTLSEDLVTMPNYEDLFYYQGTMTGHESPWVFDIVYRIDGVEVKGQDLAGKSGALEMVIQVNQGDIEKAYFYEHFALQISVALSGQVARQVVAEGATLVDAGGDKQIAFTVLPGNGAECVITADVADFEMDPIMINGVRMVFDIDVDTNLLDEQIGELTEAVEALDDGAIELKDGLNQIAEGLELYKEGVNAYQIGMSDFAAGGDELQLGLDGIAYGLSELTTNGEQLKQGIEAFEYGLLLQTQQQLQAMNPEFPALTKENYVAILSSDESLAPVLEQLSQSLLLTASMTDYINGVGAMEQGVIQFGEGLDTYIDSADALAMAAYDLYLGAEEMNNGLQAIAAGMVDFQSGTAEFRTNTSDMDEQIAEEMGLMMNQFMGDDAPLESFASDKNETIDSVQFFYRTGAITKPEVVEVIQVEEEKETFWTRLLKLFGLE